MNYVVSALLSWKTEKLDGSESTSPLSELSENNQPVQILLEKWKEKN